jgi:hypothetical protein
MKLRSVILSLLGGSVVYVTMAACATQPTKLLGSGGRGAGGSFAAGGGANGSDGGLVDALTDPVPSASADPAPGSRLKPRYWTSEDGAKQYLVGAWYDSERAEDCAFMTAADGKTRCLPQALEFAYYADAGCTQPMIMAQGSCTVPKYGISVAEASCSLEPGSARIYAVGAAINPSNFYTKAGAGCYALGPTSPDFTYYSVGAEVPPTDFVAATLAHD